MSRFQYTFMDRLKTLPGVESVGYVTTLPLDEGAGSQNITTPGLQASGAEAPLLRFAGAGGAYFQTMGIELKRGRHFERVEEEQGLPNVIVSQSAANLLYPGEDPLGKQVRPATGGPQWFTIIGVVETAVYRNLRDTQNATIFLARAQGDDAPGSFRFQVRTRSPCEGPFRRVRDAGGGTAWLHDPAPAGPAPAFPRRTALGSSP